MTSVKKCTAILILAGGIVLAQAPADKGAAPQPAAAQGGGQGRAGRGPQDYTPAMDFSGTWSMTRETADKSGTKRTTTSTFTLKQEGNKLTGTTSSGYPITGWVEGNQMSLNYWFMYAPDQTPEGSRLLLTYKDGHLVGTRSSIHDAPHKWRLDATSDADYVKQP